MVCIIQDDVPPEVKLRRLNEALSVFTDVLQQRNHAEVSSTHLVLVEGESRRSSDILTGRTCTGKRVFFSREEVAASYSSVSGRQAAADSTPAVALKAGDYVAVEVVSASTKSLHVNALARTSIAEFVRMHGTTLPGQVSSSKAVSYNA